MENVVFRREILKMAQKHGNSAAPHARKVLPFRFLSQRNSALKITSASRVPNLVKIAR